MLVVRLVQLPPSGAKHRRTESMPDTLFRINSRQLRDRMSLTDTSRHVLSEDADSKTTVSNDSGVEQSLVRIWLKCYILIFFQKKRYF